MTTPAIAFAQRRTISTLQAARSARRSGTGGGQACGGRKYRPRRTPPTVLAPHAELRCSTMTPPAPSPEQVIVSAHAVEQYRERVKPGLEPDAVRAELEQLCTLGRIHTEAPGWVNPARPAAFYLLLGDHIVLPLAPQADAWVATTCVAQRTLTPTRRAAKSARKASLAARKRAQRRTRH